MARIPVVRLATPVGSSNPNGAAIAATLPMQGPTLPREQFAVRALNRTQSAARSATVQATSSDDANCTVIRGIPFASGAAFPTPHGLTDSKGSPRAWVGYRVENVQGGFARFFATRNPAQDAYFIYVQADATCTADLRVW